MLLIGPVYPVTPVVRLLVEVFPVGKLAPGEKVFLNERKRSLDASRPVGIADLVGMELEVVAFGEGGHLRHRNHVGTRAAQYHNAGVVDHRDATAAVEVLQCLGQKHLAVEALEGWIELKKQYARIAQDRRSDLHGMLLPAHLEFVRRRVVLHLLARCKIVLSRGLLGLLADSLAAAERCQSLIGQACACREQFFMDPDQVPLATRI